jgi:hypothetical protein
MSMLQGNLKSEGTCLVEVRVCESNVVVAGNAVSQGGKALLDAANLHFVRQAVLQMLQLWRRKTEHVNPWSVAEEQSCASDFHPRCSNY